ncbi:hypothetical protein BU14_0107s0013 [Porphyra umbilicalis]|uniref:Uncharacterized protein n=1 Tax=Porphyra umbilicalis TaxID=2786 RepID=A0A1X6PCP4_PORUM|nr:hypothetical protein BU14_0107s0013 [Porphyra umbilicalis]|eukprot:OSX78506.1 hypothetical protein BU14_0107s0013 [Porphyra umbilicalis]
MNTSWMLGLQTLFESQCAGLGSPAGLLGHAARSTRMLTSTTSGVKCRSRLHTAEPPALVPQPSHALPPRPAPHVWRRRLLQPRLRQRHRRWPRRPLCTAQMGMRRMARPSPPPRPPMPARPPSRSPVAAGRLLRRGAARKHWKRRRRGLWRERPPPPRRRRRRCRRRSRCRRRCRHCPCPLHRGRRAPVCPRGGRCLPLIRRTRRRPRAATGCRRHGGGRAGWPPSRRVRLLWPRQSPRRPPLALRLGPVRPVCCRRRQCPPGRRRIVGRALGWLASQPSPPHALATPPSAFAFLLMGCTRRRRCRRPSVTVRRPAAASDAAVGGASGRGGGRRHSGCFSVCRLHRRGKSRPRRKRA